MTPEEFDLDIQERVLIFLEVRGGYVASASEAQLCRLLRAYGDARAAEERARAVQAIRDFHFTGRGSDEEALIAALRE